MELRTPKEELPQRADEAEPQPVVALSTRLYGRWLVVVWVRWLSVAGLSVGLFGAGLPVFGQKRLYGTRIWLVYGENDKGWYREECVECRYLVPVKVSPRRAGQRAASGLCSGVVDTEPIEFVTFFVTFVGRSCAIVGPSSDG